MSTILETNTKAGSDSLSDQEIHISNRFGLAFIKNYFSKKHGIPPTDHEPKSIKSEDEKPIVDTKSNIKALPGYPE